MMDGYLQICERCGKEFYAKRQRAWCTEACKKALKRRNDSQAYKEKRIKELETLGKDASYYKDWVSPKKKQEDEIESLRELIKKEEQDKRRSCMFCSFRNSDSCGIVKYEGGLTSGTYRKVPDGRCVHE